MTAIEKTDFLTILLEETIGTSPHSRETIKEFLLQMHEWTKEKALKAFCYANCTEIMKKGCECENPCKEYFIFKRKMEE